MLSRLHQIPSSPRGSSLRCPPRSRGYHAISYNHYNQYRRRRTIDIRTRISKRQFSLSKCCYADKPKGKPPPLKPPPLRPTPLRPPPLRATPLRPPPLSAAPPPLRPGFIGAGAAPVPPPRRIRRNSSIEDSVAQFFAPELAEAAQAKKLENAIDQVAREAREREAERLAFIRMLSETHEDISERKLPAIMHEMKCIEDEVRQIEKGIAQRKDQVVSHSIMERLRSFVHEQVNRQQEVVDRMIDQMPGYVEQKVDSVEEEKRKLNREEILAQRVMTAPIEEVTMSASTEATLPVQKALEPTKSTDVRQHAEEARIAQDRRIKRARIQRELHIIDLEGMLADHADDILLLNSSVLKIDMKLGELRARETREREKALAAQAVLERGRLALDEFMFTKNEIPVTIARRAEAYRIYQDKAQAAARSLDRLVDGLKDVIKSYKSHSEALQASMNKLVLTKSEITNACHQHRKYLRWTMRSNKAYCVDPTAWEVDFIGRHGVDILDNTRSALDHRPWGLKSLYPTSIIQHLPRGSSAKAKLSKEMARMLDHLDELTRFKDELQSFRELFITIECRKFRDTLRNDKSRLMQLEMIAPFLIATGDIKSTMSSALYYAERVVAPDDTELTNSPSTDMQNAIQSREGRKLFVPFQQFYTKSRDTLSSFEYLYDEWVELLWARFKLQSRFPEMNKLASNAADVEAKKQNQTRRGRQQNEQVTYQDEEFLSLEDNDYRDKLFACWANDLHLLATGKPPSDISLDHYLTTPEVNQKREQRLVPVTSAAGYRLQQEAAKAAAEAELAMANEEVARIQLQKLKGATRAQRLNKHPVKTEELGPSKIENVVDAQASANGSSEPKTTTAETGSKNSTTNMTSDRTSPEAAAASVDRVTAAVAATTVMDDVLKPVSASMTAMSNASSSATSQPMAQSTTHFTNTGGFMSAKKLGIFGALSASSSPPPPSQPQPVPEIMKQPEPAPPQYFSYKHYLSPSGEPIKLHVCSSLAEAEAICSSILSEANFQLVNGAEPVIGFDMEWKMNATVRSPLTDSVSVIQLASPSCIALLHLARFPKRKTAADLLAPSLKMIMESESILKCGVNIKSDCTRFTRVLGSVPRNIYEISLLYRLVKYSHDKVLATSRRPVQLAMQVEDVLKVSMDKTPDVRCGSWSAKMSVKQSEYAASDAYANLKLFEALETERQLMEQVPERPPMKPSPTSSSTKPKNKAPEPISPISRITRADKLNTNKYNRNEISANLPPILSSKMATPKVTAKGKTTAAKTRLRSRSSPNYESNKENIAAQDYIGPDPISNPKYSKYVSNSPSRQAAQLKKPSWGASRYGNKSLTQKVSRDGDKPLTTSTKASSWREIRVTASTKRPRAVNHAKSDVKRPERQKYGYVPPGESDGSDDGFDPQSVHSFFL